MTNDSTTPSDPELDALLDFDPVPRKCVRKDGWTADNQRHYIRGLAETGDPNAAANPLGKTARGAYELRKAAGSGAFVAAWDRALALFARRRGHPTRRPAIQPSEHASAPENDGDEVRFGSFAERILVPYMMKLDQERRCRLEGRIVEADFYVRQLTWLEVALDLGGGGVAALKALKRGGRHAGQIVATPMSLLLGDVRRAIWARLGEPERPPPPPLGRHDDEISTGEPMECQYDPARDGDHAGWRQRAAEREEIAAEAQHLWEEKARKEAAAWRARLESDGTAAGEPEGQL
jgi:hypothetical protein